VLSKNSEKYESIKDEIKSGKSSSKTQMRCRVQYHSHSPLHRQSCSALQRLTRSPNISGPTFGWRTPAQHSFKCSDTRLRIRRQTSSLTASASLAGIPCQQCLFSDGWPLLVLLLTSAAVAILADARTQIGAALSAPLIAMVINGHSLAFFCFHAT